MATQVLYQWLLLARCQWLCTLLGRCQCLKLQRRGMCEGFLFSTVGGTKNNAFIVYCLFLQHSWWCCSVQGSCSPGRLFGTYTGGCMEGIGVTNSDP